VNDKNNKFRVIDSMQQIQHKIKMLICMSTNDDLLFRKYDWIGGERPTPQLYSSIKHNSPVVYE